MQITFRDHPIIFIDIEASGLDERSFPIEIGWSADDERTPSSFLLKPDDEWVKTDAYEPGFDIHGIHYADLIQNGVHLLDVPRRLDAAWSNALLVSDAAGYDAEWISRAYAAIEQRSPWRVVEFDVLFSTLAQTGGLTPAEAAKIGVAAERGLPVPHRAGPDAHRLHKIARAAVDPVWREELFALSASAHPKSVHLF